MAKNILVPLDFHVASLNTLKIALELNSDEKFRVTLCGKHFVNSISELLLYSPGKAIGALTTVDFMQALQTIKTRFEEVFEKVSLELFHGFLQNALSHFLTAREMDEIFIPKSYTLHTSREAFEPYSFFEKFETSGLRTILGKRKQ